MYILDGRQRADIDNNGEEDCAAVVVAAFEQGDCNLRLLTDAEGALPIVRGVKEGTAPGTWH